ncbi:hypothetical protein CKA32_002013 [Geitlerinema sp. FC II]|nr:hypothetical protein CKA32_002013 [Geitlerinema sp. FC II]
MPIGIKISISIVFAVGTIERAIVKIHPGFRLQCTLPDFWFFSPTVG